MAHEKGTPVKFKIHDGEWRRGKVTARGGRTYRLKDDNGRRYSTDAVNKTRKVKARSIAPLQFGVFVFDTKLDKSLKSQRQSGVFWEQYCNAPPGRWSYANERVHSLVDLRYFLSRSISQPVLIFNGHGDLNGRGWVLSNGEFFNPHPRKDGSWCMKGGEHDCASSPQLDLHRNNHKKTIILSSCLLGGQSDLCSRMLEALDARAVIGYKAEVYDRTCYLVEPLLVHFLAECDSAAAATSKVKRCIQPLSSKVQKGARSFPLVCYPSG